MFKVLFFVIFCANHVNGENILFVNLVPSPSHHLWNEALVDGLLSKGHNVTMIGYYNPSIKDSNYNILKTDVASLLNSVASTMKDITSNDNSAFKAIFDMWSFVITCCKYNLNSQQLKVLMNYPRDFFDLLIFDITFSECYLPLMDHFGNPPTVAVTAFGMHTYINDVIGQRTENYIPHFSFPYTDGMSFFERLHSEFYLTLESASRWYYLKELNEMNRKVFGNDVRKIEDLEPGISLMFPNDDPVLDYPKPSAPNVIPIGGIHVKPPGKLDEKLEKIMNEAEDGVVFVSLGSNFVPQFYGDHAIKAFVEAFSKLNLTILWKFDDIEVPKNVIVRKWFSQKDILAHPNTKLFITHCGGLSQQETIIRGVPVVGIPLFGDQFGNAAKYTTIKGGVILKYWELTADGVHNSIVEVLSNPEYKQNMLKLSTLYKQQPQKPMEKFLMWIDYVLKNGHLDHLSLASRRMTWYQADNWDIIAFIIFIFVTIITLLNKLWCTIKRSCNTKSKKEKKQ